MVKFVCQNKKVKDYKLSIYICFNLDFPVKSIHGKEYLKEKIFERESNKRKREKINWNQSIASQTWGKIK